MADVEEEDELETDEHGIYREKTEDYSGSENGEYDQLHLFGLELRRETWYPTDLNLNLLCITGLH